MEDGEVYQLIGEDGFIRLIAAFYRQIPNDDVLGPLYPAHDFAGAEKRLRDFLIFRFGGPARYIEDRGHPRLRMRHAPFPVGQMARDRDSGASVARRCTSTHERYPPWQEA